MNSTEDQITWPGWQTVRKLGSGTFGAVYEIQRCEFGITDKAALKVISVPKDYEEIKALQENDYDDESIRQRFKNDLGDIVKEYQLMSQLKGCGNIVYCEDWRYIPQENGLGWNLLIKMELLTPLKSILSKEISAELTVKVGMDLCSALIACKKHNIIHRDIKPENILLADDGTCKLGDFGVAKSAGHTTSGTKTGTFNYMAPEVYNNRKYGASVDIYSLGMVMYWLLNERCGPFLPLPPMIPKASQEESARQQRFDGKALPPPAHGSKELKEIVLKACAFDPKDRFSSPEEMYEALCELSGNATISPTHRTYQPKADDTSTAENTLTVSDGSDQTLGNAWEPTVAGTIGTGSNITETNDADKTIGAEPKTEPNPRNTKNADEERNKQDGFWENAEDERARAEAGRLYEESQRRELEKAESQRRTHEAIEALKREQKILDDERLIKNGKITDIAIILILAFAIIFLLTLFFSR